MSNKFNQLLLIQSSEVNSVRFMFIFSLLFGIPQIITMTVGSTLVIRDYSPEVIPTLFLLSGIFITFLSILLIILIKSISIENILKFITGFLSFGTLLITISITLLPDIKWISALVFIWSRTENSLLAVCFLVLGNSLFHPRASRRLLGLTSSGQVFTLVLGGLLIPVFLKYFSPKDLLWFSLLAHILMFIHCFKDIKLSQFEITVGDKKGKSLLWVYITVIVLLLYLIYYTIDSSFLASINMSFSNEKDISIYISRFWVVVGITALFIKLFITGRILHRLGLLFGMLLSPLFFIVLSIFFTINSELDLIPALYFFVLLKGVERVLDGSIFIPSLYGLFQGIEIKSRLKIQITSESVMPQIASGAIGIIFFFLGQDIKFSYLNVIVIVFLTSLILALLAYLGFREYKKEMEVFLRIPSINTSENIESITPDYNKPQSIPLNPTVDEVRSFKGPIDIEAWHNAFIHQVLILKSLRKDKPNTLAFSPLLDVWNFEWGKKEELIIRILQKITGNKEIFDRWKKLRSIPPQQQLQGIEGLSMVLKQPYKEPLLSILAYEECFLIEKSIKNFIKETRVNFPFSPNNMELTNWTRKVLKISYNSSRDKDWEEYKILSLLKESEFFTYFPLEYLKELLPYIKENRYLENDQIIREGDMGESMHIQTTGESIVTVNNTLVAKLQPGACYGELSAILPERRSATIIAKTSVETLELPGASYIAFLDNHWKALTKVQMILFFRIENLISPPPNSIKYSSNGYYYNEDDLDFLTIQNNLKDLDSEVIKKISLNSKGVKLNKGDRFRLIGEDEPNIYILKKGILKEYWGSKFIGIRTNMDFVSISRVVYPSNYETYVEAMEDTELVEISYDAYVVLLSEEPKFQLYITRELVKINRDLLKKHR